MMNDTKYYWLTLVNSAKGGGSANLGPFPMTKDEVLDSCYFDVQPFQIVGFSTAKERIEIHKFLLTAPIPDIEAKWEALRPKYDRAEMAVITLGRSRSEVKDGWHRN